MWRPQLHYGNFSELLRAFSAMSTIAPVQCATLCPDTLTTSSPAKAAYGPVRAANSAEAELKHWHVMSASTLHSTASASDSYCSPRWRLATMWGYTPSPAGSVTEATFCFLAGDGSRVSSCAVPLVLQVREETQLLNWLAQIRLEESFWAAYRDLKLHSHSKKQPWKLGSTIWNKHILFLVPLIPCAIKSVWTEFPIGLLF